MYINTLLKYPLQEKVTKAKSNVISYSEFETILEFKNNPETIQKSLEPTEYGSCREGPSHDSPRFLILSCDKRYTQCVF